jgi:putative SOS response-associated peptidase YedK
MVAEVMHGAPYRFTDPARFSFAHGGKDRHPFPVPIKVYDETIKVLKSAVQKAKLGREEELGALRRLDEQARRLERHAGGPSVEELIHDELHHSHSYGGRSVFGLEPAPETPARTEDRDLSTSAPECAACGGDGNQQVCNLYSLTKGQQAIRELARAMSDRTGNLPPLPGIFPDYRAPIVRNQPEGRELSMARWGMPSTVFALKGRNSDTGVTNIRNVKSPHWRRWLGVEHRCVVPFTSFSENETLPNGSKPPVWFAFDETRPLAFFAGIWTRWTSVRKVKEGETTNDLFGFLTTEANKEVGAIHPKAMPVILTTRQEIDLWMTAPAEDALKLQRPLADGALMIVARGEKQDEGGLAA